MKKILSSLMIIVLVSCSQVATKQDVVVKKTENNNFIATTSKGNVDFTKFESYYYDQLYKQRVKDENLTLAAKSKILNDFVVEEEILKQAKIAQLDTVKSIKSFYDEKLDKVIIGDLYETKVLNKFIDKKELMEEFKLKNKDVDLNSFKGFILLNELKNNHYRSEIKDVQNDIQKFFTQIRAKHNVKVDSVSLSELIKISKKYNAKTGTIRDQRDRKLIIPKELEEKTILSYDGNLILVKDFVHSFDEMRRRFIMRKTFDVFQITDRLYMSKYLLQEAKENKLDLKEKNINFVKSRMYPAYYKELESRYIDKNSKITFTQDEMKAFYIKKKDRLYKSKKFEEVQERITKSLKRENFKFLKKQFKIDLFKDMNVKIDNYKLEEFSYKPLDNKR